VKFHLKTKQGIRNLRGKSQSGSLVKTRIMPLRIYFQAIANGQCPKWRLSVQIMPEIEAGDYHINPFDLTQVWPHVTILDRGWRVKTQSNPEELLRRDRAGFIRAGDVVFPASVFRPTRCFKLASFRTRTRNRYRSA